MKEKALLKSQTTSIILIPARYQSTRFPGKPLALINGKTMIQRVYANAAATQLPSYVVTDSQAIENHCHSIGAKVLRVDDDLRSGSQRILMAYERFLKKPFPEKVTLVNLQGDEPLARPEEILKLIHFHHDHPQFDLATLVKKRGAESEKNFYSPNVVKVAYTPQTNECHFFSRSPIPYYHQDTAPKIWYQHLGLYSYSASLFDLFQNGPVSDLEKIENLEQLRALEAGFRVGATLTEMESIGVDCPEDIEKVQGVLNESNQP
jgi:3-deoxy-manno-octulosonate cytidylyltransferase (CMP-KDO synthetase)